MFKLMIVDDDEIVRSGIRCSVSFDNFGIEKILEAENGQKALKLFRQEHVDILITDMKMPVMDGIALIQNMMQLDPGVKIIVVSGYSDYEYLREAIRLNVVSYLLKPIDSRELEGLLDSITTTLERERAGSLLVWQGMNLLRQNTLYRLLEGRIDNREWREKSTQMSLPLRSGPFCIALIAITAEPSEWAWMLPAAANVTDEIMEQEQQGIAFEYAGCCVAMLFDGSYPAGALQAKLDEMCALLQRQKIFCDGAIGQTVMEPEEIAFSYQCALQKLQPRADAAAPSYCKLVRDLLAYIQTHFREEITLKSIADEFYVNPSYLGSLFKKEYGMSFNECVNQFRLEQARLLLETSNMKIYAVAQEVGFKATRYFTSLFKKHFGIQPSEVRRYSNLTK